MIERFISSRGIVERMSKKRKRNPTPGQIAAWGEKEKECKAQGKILVRTKPPTCRKTAGSSKKKSDDISLKLEREQLAAFKSIADARDRFVKEGKCDALYTVARYIPVLGDDGKDLYIDILNHVPKNQTIAPETMNVGFMEMFKTAAKSIEKRNWKELSESIGEIADMFCKKEEEYSLPPRHVCEGGVCRIVRD